MKIGEMEKSKNITSAIEILNDYVNVEKFDADKARIIIELLQEGEEYKRILKHIGVLSTDEQVNRIIRDTLLGG